MHLRMVALILAVAAGTLPAQSPGTTPGGSALPRSLPKPIDEHAPDAVAPGEDKPKPVRPVVVPVAAETLEEIPPPSANPALPEPDESPGEEFIPRNAPRWWVGADYLLWRTKSMPVNSPFVTTGPESDLFAGSLGRPGTQALYGGKAIDTGLLSGMRLRAGLWLDDDATLGVELGGLLLEQGGETARFSGGANGANFFGIPFRNARTGEQNIFFVSQNFNDPSISAFLTGQLDISTKTSFWTSEVNALVNLRQSEDSWLIGMVGFRTMGLDESIRFAESLRSLVPGGSVTFGGATIDPSQSVGTNDLFKTSNRFYGPQLGTRFGTNWGGIVLSAHAAVALGVNQQDRTIEGSSTLMTGGRTISTLPGGVFALSSNMGRLSQNDFSVVPEAGLSLGYQFTPWLSAKLGYNFVYWNTVARATQQVDSTINPGLVPTDLSYGSGGGPNRPGAGLRTSDFWAQGINFGIEIKR